MRALLVLLPLTLAGSAQAQYPAPYLGGYQPYGGPYASPPVPRGPPQSLAQGMLGAHNAIRSRIGVPPLVWSAHLAAVANEWANYLIASHGFAHRPNNRYGENIFASSAAAASPARVVASWGEEVRGYDLRSNTCYGTCGHYTQIVWRTTRAVGCGVATDWEREIWVCNYDPPGNIVGERPY